MEDSGEFPWTWRPSDIEDFLAERRSGEKPISLSTLRADSNAVAMFCSYLTHPSYGWGDFCERTFGDVPSQICFEWNSPRHTTDDAVPPGRRAFTRDELQRLFDHIDDLVDLEYAAGSKRWLPALRDSIAFKVCYAYGLRRREAGAAGGDGIAARSRARRGGRCGSLAGGRAASRISGRGCSSGNRAAGLDGAGRRRQTDGWLMPTAAVPIGRALCRRTHSSRAATWLGASSSA